MPDSNAPLANPGRASEGLAGTFWPSAQQERLLEVALGAGEEAIAAWRSVRPEFVLDELEPGSFDLMSLVYRRLSEAGEADPLIERLKGIYRREWVRGNVLVDQTKKLASALSDSGVAALFIEGAPLAVRYYPERGLRPSWFVDLLVEQEGIEQALQVLEALGWRAPAQSPGLPAADRFALSNAERSVCVLRSTLGVDFIAADAGERPNEPLWRSRRAVGLDGIEIATPGATETLLAVVVTGARRQPLPSLSWIVDAVMMLRGEEIDGPRLAALAASRGQALRLRDALTYISRLGLAPVPEAALEALAGLRPTRRERLAYALASGALPRGGALPEQFARHLAASSGRSLPATVATFPGYLRLQWGLAHGWELPYAVARRAFRRIAAGAGRG